MLICRNAEGVHGQERLGTPALDPKLLPRNNAPRAMLSSNRKEFISSLNVTSWAWAAWFGHSVKNGVLGCECIVTPVTPETRSLDILHELPSP